MGALYGRNRRRQVCIHAGLAVCMQACICRGISKKFVKVVDTVLFRGIIITQASEKEPRIKVEQG